MAHCGPPLILFRIFYTDRLAPASDGAVRIDLRDIVHYLVALQAETGKLLHI
jgi:hypothetical protein